MPRSSAAAAFIDRPELLRNPHVRLLNFPRAEALTKIFPFLVRLVLPAGVVDFANNNPPADVNLLGATNAVLVRKDLHPQIVALLAQALMEVHGEAGLFQRAGEFPTLTDPEYPMAESARDFYKSGPGLMNCYLPFWVTNYLQRTLAIVIAAIAIVVPVFRVMPMLFSWLIRQQCASSIAASEWSTKRCKRILASRRRKLSKAIWRTSTGRQSRSDAGFRSAFRFQAPSRPNAFAPCRSSRGDKSRATGIA